MAAARGNRVRLAGVHATSAALMLVVALAGCTSQTSRATQTGTHSAINATPTQTPTAGSGPTAQITIAGVDVDGLHLTVGGFVTLVAEDGGSCTFTLTSEVSGANVTAATEGVANGTNTSCGSTQVSLSSLTRGSWKVVLTYSSTAFKLASAPTEVEVP
jgi:hypothetical protein